MRVAHNHRPNGMGARNENGFLTCGQCGQPCEDPATKSREVSPVPVLPLKKTPMPSDPAVLGGSAFVEDVLDRQTPEWAFVYYSQANVIRGCGNCGKPVGCLHETGCYEMAKARQHAVDHLNDGQWHDNCWYCRHRRVHGGSGFPSRQGGVRVRSFDEFDSEEALVRWALAASDDEVGPACMNVPIWPTIAADDARHALAAVRDALRAGLLAAALTIGQDDFDATHGIDTDWLRRADDD